MSVLSGFRVAVLATDGFEEAELMKPVEALKEAGASVSIVSLKPGTIQGVQKDKDKGAKISVDHGIQEGEAMDFDGVHLPGGTLNADQLRMVPEVQQFLREMQDAGKPIAAICHAPWELVSAGLVSGRRLTSYYTVQDDIKNAGGIWIDQPVVIDDNWVTSRKPDDLPGYIDAMISVFSASTICH